MRTRFDEQLEQLNNELIVMGDLCEEAINNVVKALIEGDEERLNRVFEIDTKIDRKEKDIESLCNEAHQYGFASVCVNPMYIVNYWNDTVVMFPLLVNILNLFNLQ